MRKIAATRNYKTAGPIEDAKGAVSDSVAQFIRDNATELSEYFPYGTQTIAKTLITAKADEIADCVVEVASPV